MMKMMMMTIWQIILHVILWGQHHILCKRGSIHRMKLYPFAGWVWRRQERLFAFWDKLYGMDLFDYEVSFIDHLEPVILETFQGNIIETLDE